MDLLNSKKTKNSELDLSSKESFGPFNHSREHFANVPLDIFYSKGSSKIQVLKCKGTVLWENKSNSQDFVKILFVYSSSEGLKLVDLVECCHGLNNCVNHMTNHLNHCTKDQDVVHRRVKMVNNGGVWKRIDKFEFFSCFQSLLESLPPLDTEKRLEGNMELYKATKKPKYFAIDLDGTFLTFNTANLTENIKTFQKLRDNNYVPFFCTARSVSNFFDDFNELLRANSDYKGFPGVYNNGSAVFNEAGELVHKSTFSREYLRKMAKFVRNNGLEDGVVFHDVKHFYCLTEPVRIMSRMLLFYEWFQPVQVDEKELLEKEVVMVYLSVNHENDLVADAGELIVQHVDHTLNVTIYDLFSEVTPLNTSKYDGVRKLIEYYQSRDPEMSPKDNIYFIGDGDNDINIMKFLDYSFSVANASNRVKKCAKYILNYSNSQGGVHKLLNHIYFDQPL